MSLSERRVRWSDLQQRIESTEFGRGAISAFIVVTVAFVVATNLPASELRSKLMSPGQPYLNALGLDQAWNVFAPDPRKFAIDMRAIIRYDDGSTAVWTIPKNDPVIGAYRDYRWRKWLENVIQDANPALWKPAALWAAKQEPRRGRRPVQVQLERRFAQLLPPGESHAYGPWQSYTYYTLKITGPV